MKRILQVGMSDNYGGIESFIINYYRQINRGQIQFDFLKITENLAYEEEIINMGGKIWRITDFRDNPIKYCKELYQIMKRYDCVHIQMMSAANILPVLVAKKAGTSKVIVHAHSTRTFGTVRTVLHYINTKIMRQFKIVRLACSDTAGEWMYEKKSFDIIHNAVDYDKFKYKEEIRKSVQCELNIPESTLVIGNIGALVYEKNQGFLLNVFSEIQKEIPNSILIIVGVGELEDKLMEEVRRLKIQDKVKFLGRRTDVDRIYNVFDVFMLPSLFEGLPVTLVEAQTNGLNCFTSKGNVPDECKILDNVYFISLDEPYQAWANQIIKIGKNRLNNTKERIENAGYNIRRSSNQLMNIYLN